jgi:hypothetical protein
MTTRKNSESYPDRVVNPWHDVRNPNSPVHFDIGGPEGDDHGDYRFLRVTIIGNSPHTVVSAVIKTVEENQ